MSVAHHEQRMDFRLLGPGSWPWPYRRRVRDETDLIKCSVWRGVVIVKTNLRLPDR